MWNFVGDDMVYLEANSKFSVTVETVQKIYCSSRKRSKEVDILLGSSDDQVTKELLSEVH